MLLLPATIIRHHHCNHQTVLSACPTLCSQLFISVLNLYHHLTLSSSHDNYYSITNFHFLITHLKILQDSHQFKQSFFFFFKATWSFQRDTFILASLSFFSPLNFPVITKFIVQGNFYYLFLTVLSSFCYSEISLSNPLFLPFPVQDI